MKKPFFLILLLAFLTVFSACNVNVNVSSSGSSDNSKASSETATVGYRDPVLVTDETPEINESISPKALTCYNDVREYDFSPELQSQIEQKIKDKEYSVFADIPNYRAIAICDLDSDGEAEAFVVDLCSVGNYSKLELLDFNGGKISYKNAEDFHNGNSDSYEINPFDHFDGLKVSDDGHEIIASCTFYDGIRIQSCRVNNGKFVFKKLESKEYEHNMTELFSVIMFLKENLSYNDYKSIKAQAQSNTPAVFENKEAMLSIAVCDIDSDGEYDAVLVKDEFTAIPNKGLDVFSLRDGDFYHKCGFHDTREGTSEKIASFDTVGISKNGTDVVFYNKADNADKNKKISVRVDGVQFIFTENEVKQ